MVVYSSWEHYFSWYTRKTLVCVFMVHKQNVSFWCTDETLPCDPRTNVFLWCTDKALPCDVHAKHYFVVAITLW